MEESYISVQKNGITTVVAYKAHVDGNENGPHPTYYVEHFVYDKERDCYTCPNGNILTTSGAWHNKSKENSPYQFKKYRTPDCKGCPVKHLCTGRKGGREIERSQYQDAVDRNNERIKKQKELYLKRQAIVEHPFGTIKRSWGYSYTLLKGLRKVDDEMNLIALVYNLRRAINILSTDTLLKALQSWTPNYEKVLPALKTALTRSIEMLFRPLRFLQPQLLLLKKTTSVSLYQSYMILSSTRRKMKGSFFTL